jgi:hypothetical protein
VGRRERPGPPIATTTSRPRPGSPRRATVPAHIAALFKLIGRDDAAARRAADTVMAIELGLACATLENVAARSDRDRPRDDRGAAPEAHAELRLVRVLKASGIHPANLNVTEPEFLRRSSASSPTPVADWRTYLSGT